MNADPIKGRHSAFLANKNNRQKILKKYKKSVDNRFEA